MTERNKKLLLDDLAKRLGNDVKMGDNRGHIGTLKIIDHIHNTIGFKTTNMYGEDSVLIKGRIDFWKPYLRPMQSMTKVEKKEISELIDAPIEIDSDGDIIYLGGYSIIPCSDYQIYIDYLISHHFDFRGLIPMGLAIEAPEGMYKINTK